VRVAVLSPFPAERGALDALLRDEGHEVTCAASRDEGLALVMLSRPDVLIADTQLLGIEGLARVRELSQKPIGPRTILLCTRSSAARAHTGMLCMTKPIDLAELFRHLMPREPAKVAAR